MVFFLLGFYSELGGAEAALRPIFANITQFLRYSGLLASQNPPEFRAGSLSEGQGYFLVFAAGSSLIRMFRNLIPAPCPSSPMCPEALKSPGWFLWSTV